LTPRLIRFMITIKGHDRQLSWLKSKGDDM